MVPPKPPRPPSQTPHRQPLPLGVPRRYAATPPRASTTPSRVVAFAKPSRARRAATPPATTRWSAGPLRPRDRLGLVPRGVMLRPRRRRWGGEAPSAWPRRSTSPMTAARANRASPVRPLRAGAKPHGGHSVDHGDDIFDERIQQACALSARASQAPPLVSKAPRCPHLWTSEDPAAADTMKGMTMRFETCAAERDAGRL